MKITHFYNPPMPPSQHPTTNETIDTILRTMEPDRFYPFGEKWGPAYKYSSSPSEQHQNIAAIRRCIKTMKQNKLIDFQAGVISQTDQEIMDNADWNTVVVLSVFGDKVREEGGWLKYLERQNTTVPKKGFSRYLDTGVKITAIIEGIVIIVLTPIALYLQSNNNKLEIENISLKSENESLSKQVYSLKSDVTNQELKIKALTDSTVVLKKAQAPKKPKKK